MQRTLTPKRSDAAAWPEVRMTAPGWHFWIWLLNMSKRRPILHRSRRKLRVDDIAVVPTFFAAMALFFPTLFNGNGYLADTEPEEFADIFAARASAICNIREIIAEEVRLGTPINLGHFIEIRDANGVALQRIYFRDAVKFEDFGTEGPQSL